jgi:DNA-directed RNA polymerase specialized sigma24 family protein
VRAWLLRITVNVCQHWRRRGFGRRLAYEFPLPADDRGEADLGTYVTVRTAYMASWNGQTLRRTTDDGHTWT